MLYMPRGVCAFKTLEGCVPPTTSFFCASSALGTKAAPGINPYRMGRFSRGPVLNASKRQCGSANMGLAGPIFDIATQGFRNKSCLGDWRCKGPSEEVYRRRLGWTASRKTSRPSGRSCGTAKDGSESHAELFSRKDGIE